MEEDWFAADVPPEGHDDEQDADGRRQEVDESGLFRDAVGRNGGDNGRAGRADVGAESDDGGRVVVHQTIACEYDSDTGTGGAALDDDGRDDADEQGSERGADGHDAIDWLALECLENLVDAWIGGKLMKFVAHDFHAEKQEAEAHDGHAPLFDDALLEEGHDDTDNDGGHADAADFKGDDLAGDGRTDVRAENNADGLFQREQSCVDETNDHDGCGSRRLDK